MATNAQRSANRANALKSTGPVDTSTTRFNGLAHGLTSKHTVIPGEDQTQYEAFQQALLRDLAAASATESVLADRIVAAAWRLKRFVRIESAFFTSRIEAFLKDNPGSDPDVALANLFSDPGEMARMRLFLRYQNSVQREYDTLMREFQKAKAERATEAAGGVTVDDLLRAIDAPMPISEAYASTFAPVGFASQFASATALSTRS